MDKTVKVVVGFLVAISIFACGEIKMEGDDKALLPKSSGKYGEVLVVVDTFFENRKTGEQIQEIFNKSLEGLPQQEPQFRTSTVPPKGFQSILKRSRNILKLSIGNGKKSGFKIEEDVWAKDQLMIHISAGNDVDAARILSKNIATIRNYFNEKELERLEFQYRGKPQKDVMETMAEEYKLSLLIPPGFVEMAKSETGFWLKKDKTIGQHQVLQGVSVTIRPYITDSIFNFEAMVPVRDEFTKEMIQGVRDSSFMAVYKEYLPVEQEINLNGFYAKEYRGLWNMENDFMGGPFLHYTLVDEKNNRVIELDAFVYAPKFEKREYLRELEAILKTFKLH